MKRYPHYKPSGIQWIGDVPEHWKKARLFSVAYEHYISNKTTHHQNLLSLSYGRIIRKDINTTDGLLPASFDGYQIVEPDNVVLRLTDLQNDHRSLRVGFVTETGIITSAYLCLAARKNIVPQYLYLYLHTNDVHKVFYGMGGGLRQSLDYSELRKLPVFIPPSDEQQAIVDFIDHKIREIDGYIAAKEAEIEKLGTLKQTIIQRAVTRGLDPNAPMKDSQIPWIGDVPKHWKTMRLAVGFSENKWKNSDYLYHSALKFYYGALVSKNESGDLSDLHDTYVDYTVLKQGDIVINGLNLNYDFVSLRVAQATSGGIITSAYLTITPREGFNSDFYTYFFKAMDAKKLFHGMGTGIRLTLSYSELKKQPILIPPPEEQSDIVKYIDRKIREIDGYIGKIREQIEKLKLYKQRLISDAVTGKIDVRTTSPAGE